MRCFLLQVHACCSDTGAAPHALRPTPTQQPAADVHTRASTASRALLTTPTRAPLSAACSSASEARQAGALSERYVPASAADAHSTTSAHAAESLRLREGTRGSSWTAAHAHPGWQAVRTARRVAPGPFACAEAAGNSGLARLVRRTYGSSTQAKAPSLRVLSSAGHA
jgi:hypothetical protein